MADPQTRASRLSVAMHVYVRGEDVSGIPFDMEVDSQNVSRGGLAYNSPQEIAMGASVDVVVERPPIGPREMPPLFTTAKVVRITPAQGGGFEVALQFTGPKLMIFAKESDASA